MRLAGGFDSLDPASKMMYQISIIIVGLILVPVVSTYRNFLFVRPILLLKDPTKPGELPVSYLLLPVSVKLLGWVTSGICTDIFGSEKVVGIMIIALSMVMEVVWDFGLVHNEFYICGFGFLEGATKIVGAILISRIAGRVNAGLVIFSAIYVQCLGALSSEMHSMTTFTDIVPSPSDVHRIYAFRIFVPAELLTAITTCLAVGYGFYCYWKRPIWAQLRQHQHHEYLMVIAGLWFLSGLSYLSQLLYLNLMFRSAPLVPPANLKTLLLIATLVFVCLVFFIRCDYRCLIFVVFFFLKAVFMVTAFLFQIPFKKKDYKLELFWPYFIDNTISNVVNATIVVVAAESFPEETRAACLVISGAAGMFGEILAALWFLRAGHRIWLSFFLLVVISLIAVFTSGAVPDPPNNQQNPAPPNNQQDNQQNPAPPNNQPGDHQE